MTNSRALRALAASICLFAAGALPATAQTAAPAETAPPAAAAAPLAKASPEQLKAAMDLLDAIDAEAQYGGVIPDMFLQLREDLPAEAKTPEQAKNVDEVVAEVEKEFEGRRGELVEQIATLYASKFTVDEMNGLAEFYRTPLGQKFIAAAPELASEALRIGDEWDEKVGGEAYARIVAELQKRGVSL